MKGKERLYAVIGGCVGAVLTMMVCSFAPLAVAQEQTAEMKKGIEVAKRQEVNKGLVAVQKEKDAGEMARLNKKQQYKVNKLSSEVLAMVELMKQLPPELQLSDDTIKRLIKRKLQNVTEPNDLIMKDELLKDVADGKITEAQMIQMWQYYNKVSDPKAGSSTSGSGTGTTGAGTIGAKPAMKEREYALTAIKNAITNELPLETTDDARFGGFMGWGGEGRTTGRMPTDEEYQRAAQLTKDRLRELGRMGYNIGYLSQSINQIKEQMIKEIRETGGQSREQPLPKKGPLTAEWNSKNIEDSNEWATIEKIKENHRLYNFFQSPAGVNFNLWLSASARTGQWIED